MIVLHALRALVVVPLHWVGFVAFTVRTDESFSTRRATLATIPLAFRRLYERSGRFLVVSGPNGEYLQSANGVRPGRLYFDPDARPALYLEWRSLDAAGRYEYRGLGAPARPVPPEHVIEALSDYLVYGRLPGGGVDRSQEARREGWEVEP